MYKKPRLPKKEYFAKRIDECREAGLTDKANYYQARLDELNKLSTEDLLREFIDSHTKDLSRSIVATPTSEYLDEFAMANQGSSDLLLIQMAKQYGAKLIIDELSNLINK